MIRGRNKYIFSLSFDDGETYDPVVLTKSPAIQGSKEENLGDYRLKTGTWKFVKHENPSLYGRILYVLETPSSSLTPIKVKIELLNSEETIAWVVYQGYITLEGIHVDASDGGTISFTPEEAGTYLWYEQNKTTKKDLVSLANAALYTNTINIDDTSVPVEYWLPLSLECDHFNNFFELEHSDGDNNGCNIQHWSDEQGITYVGYDDDRKFMFKEGWVVHPATWKYYYCIKTHTPSSLNEPGFGPQASEYWIGFDWYPYENAVYHVIQQRSDFALPNFVKGNGYYQPMFESGTGDDTLATNCPDTKYCLGAQSVVTGTAIVTTTGNIKIADAFNYLLEGSGLTFYSQLLAPGTNPVTGQPNKYSNMFLSHRGFLKGTQSEDTKGEVSLDELINDICELLNCRWYIDPVNEYLVIEHVNFFLYGFTYLEGSPAIYADLTDTTKYKLKEQIIFDINGDPTDKNFKYGKNLQKKEIFKINDTYDYDNYITYSSHFAKSSDELTHNISLISTDFMFVIKAVDKSSDDQFCLISCSDDGNIIHRRDTYMHHRLTQKINYPNGDLIMYNILTDLWRYDRIFKSGSLNLEPRSLTFFTAKKNKIQKDLRFPRIEVGPFDPQKLIKTNIGDGEVQEFEIETDSDYINVTLIYDIDR